MWNQEIVTSLATEISELLCIDATLNSVENASDFAQFKQHLSAFLSELGCMNPTLVQGDVAQRFETSEDRSVLLEFLLAQVKPARLIALRRLRESEDEEAKRNNPHHMLASFILHDLKMQRCDPSDLNKFSAQIKTEIQKSLTALNRRPKPWFDLKLTEKEWRFLAEYAHKFSADYAIRTEMLLRRFDVTVDSFFWSERGHSLRNDVMRIYKPQRAELGGWRPIGLEHLLAATEDLFVVEKASSGSQRRGTRSQISAFIMQQKPVDRGGRTSDVMALPKETFQDQRREFGQRGGRGRIDFDQFRGQRENRFENEVKKEYGAGRSGHRGGSDRGRRGRRN